ncbi:hypothetical protein [Streptomyces sp. ALI-76-A]|uniref:hypothetical protein n=1 Tax=Streptomyces sp. ALI-76-A TaxID=3025736 RepID=UPI00256F3BE1|nr:hypothetical protein [Streptomyces sp. ALI-76-A]MDL5206514.1 hypothetical protein [Streptomyces sp. ALI-76-A]
MDQIVIPSDNRPHSLPHSPANPQVTTLVRPWSGGPARHCHHVRTDQVPDPCSALVLACILQLTGTDEGARFWWASTCATKRWGNGLAE